GTSGPVCSSIYAARFGRQGLMGLQNGGIQVERVGELETKDATRTRIKWYCGLALMGTLGLARLSGINGS
ncbi:MAG TPA: phage major capsid protein, partial [Thermomicrobiales bacterium]|nr:phage major capsid protein [Thermomicrobiales bacterium]